MTYNVLMGTLNPIHSLTHSPDYTSLTADSVNCSQWVTRYTGGQFILDHLVFWLVFEHPKHPSRSRYGFGLC